MNGLPPRPLKVEQDFTDARLTGFGGWSALATARERQNAVSKPRKTLAAEQTAAKEATHQPLNLYQGIKAHKGADQALDRNLCYRFPPCGQPRPKHDLQEGLRAAIARRTIRQRHPGRC